MSKKKLILIDGNSLLYRAFFALPTTLTTSTGVITNAVYGFTSMIIRLIKDESPDCLAVAFDKGIVTFRHDTFSDYKAHRDETPDELRHQFDLVKELLESLSIPYFEKEGYEADDILATIARQNEGKETDVLVVTGDRDAFQLISDNTNVMTTRKGISDIVIYDRDKLMERYGITPNQMPDMLGLKGDPSDNIPGVPGVGEKTATKLIQEYGSMENVFAKVEEIKGNKLKENLRNFKKQAEISKELATLHFEVPIDFDFNKCALEWDLKTVRDMFLTLQFNTLYERIKELTPEDQKEESFKPVIEETTFEKIEDILNETKQIGIELITEDGQIKNILLCLAEKVFVLSGLEIDKIKLFLEDEKIIKSAYDSKTIMNILRFYDIRLASTNFDVVLACYLLEPTKTNYQADEICFRYLGKAAELNKDSLINKSLACYLAYNLEKPLRKELKRNNLLKVYEELELKLAPILAAMEFRGVGINKEELKNYSDELGQLINKSQEEIFRYSESEFNINSTAQLSEILFDKLKLKPIKKTKTGYSTDSGVLSKLINDHPIIEHIINYRELGKLKSTYVDALPKLINSKTKRLHTTFNQTVTATGRLSSSNPNLQNIPIRTDIGKRIRKSFIPARKTDLLLVADYSQIELRILASMAEDEALIKAFENHADIHKATASEVFNQPIEKVTDEMRYKAKAVNFGIVYGISSYGLAAQLKVSTEEAANFIDLYFSRYPKIKSFIDSSIEKAYVDGFVKTLYGRYRPLPELKSKDFRIKNFGERSAINSIIQGSAADIIKQAMINIEERLVSDALMSRMVLQVHDELVFEAPSIEISSLTDIVKEEMESAYKLNPKLEVNIGVGPNWLEAK